MVAGRMEKSSMSAYSGRRIHCCRTCASACSARVAFGLSLWRKENRTCCGRILSVAQVNPRPEWWILCAGNLEKNEGKEGCLQPSAMRQMLA